MFLSFGIDTDENKGRTSSLEESFKPLQVGITNPTPTQQSGHISPTFPSITITDDTSPPPIFDDRRRTPPKSLPGPDSTGTGAVRQDAILSPTSKQNPTIQNIQYAVPILPGQSSSTIHDEKGGSFLFLFLKFHFETFILESIQTTPANQSDYRLGKFSWHKSIRVIFLHETNYFSITPNLSV